MSTNLNALGRMIDHAVLGPGKTARDLEEGVRIALSYNCASVCCNPGLFTEACRLLANSKVAPSTVIDFPHGSSSPSVRLAMVDAALNELQGQFGEIDIVAPQGLIAAENWDGVSEDLFALIERVHAARSGVKIIFENCYRTSEQIRKLSVLCVDLRADYVKTSTGFGYVAGKGMVGAKLEDVQLMHTCVAGRAQVKASGGLRSYADLLALLPYCDRFGLSGTEMIMREAADQSV